MSAAAEAFIAYAENIDAQILLPSMSGDALWNFDGFPQAMRELQRMFANPDAVWRRDENTFEVHTTDIDDTAWTVVVRVIARNQLPPVFELIAVQRGPVSPHAG